MPTQKLDPKEGSFGITLDEVFIKSMVLRPHLQICCCNP